MKHQGRRILEAGFFLTLFLAPAAFGSVYPWGTFSICAILFFLFALYPETIFKIDTFPRVFRVGAAVVFGIILIQLFFTSTNRYGTEKEILKWLALAAAFILVQSLPRPALVRLLGFLILLGVLEVVAGDGIEPPTQGFSVLCSTN